MYKTQLYVICRPQISTSLLRYLYTLILFNVYVVISGVGRGENFDPETNQPHAFCYWFPYINVCKIIPPECMKTHHFDIKKFSGEPYPTPSGEGDTPSPHLTPFGTSGTSNSTPSASHPPLKLNPCYVPVPNCTVCDITHIYNLCSIV